MRQGADRSTIRQDLQCNLFCRAGASRKPAWLRTGICWDGLDLYCYTSCITSHNRRARAVGDLDHAARRGWPDPRCRNFSSLFAPSMSYVQQKLSHTSYRQFKRPKTRGADIDPFSTAVPFGGKLLRIWLACPWNGTAVLHTARTSTLHVADPGTAADVFTSRVCIAKQQYPWEEPRWKHDVLIFTFEISSCLTITGDHS